MAQWLFRHKVFGFLLRKELISPERVELLSSWRHSGFITQPQVIQRILDHLRQSQKTCPRPPPGVPRQPSPAL